MQLTHIRLFNYHWLISEHMFVACALVTLSHTYLMRHMRINRGYAFLSDSLQSQAPNGSNRPRPSFRCMTFIAKYSQSRKYSCINCIDSSKRFIQPRFWPQTLPLCPCNNEKQTGNSEHLCHLKGRTVPHCNSWCHITKWDEPLLWEGWLTRGDEAGGGSEEWKAGGRLQCLCEEW